MIADSIPRYAAPTWSELNEDPLPAEVMRECMHCNACLRMLESFAGDTFDTSINSEWERAAIACDCVHCLEMA